MRRFHLMAALLMAAWLPLAAQAELRSERVSYRDGGVTLEGYLTWDDAVTGRRPGVLIAHEWWGLNDYIRERARQFAELGYVAFALDLYGEGQSTGHPTQAKEWMEQVTADAEAWRRRAQAGLNVLRNHRLTDGSRIAAVGYCFGGGTVMQLAYAGAELPAVISFHGPLPTPTPDQAKAIRGAIFAAHGSQDANVTPAQVQAFQAALDAAEVDWHMLVLGGARHAFTNPDADQHGIENLKYDEQADRRSWAAARHFLEERLGKR
jgi:dienelactone hydrolase